MLPQAGQAQGCCFVGVPSEQSTQPSEESPKTDGGIGAGTRAVPQRGQWGFSGRAGSLRDALESDRGNCQVRAFNKSRISVSSCSWVVSGGGTGGFLSIIMLTALTSRKTQNATMTKSTMAWTKGPYLTRTGSPLTFRPTSAPRSLKFVLPIAMPKGGVRMSATSELTILPNAAPITTPTAMSNTLPRRAKALNSWIRPIASASFLAP